MGRIAGLVGILRRGWPPPSYVGRCLRRAAPYCWYDIHPRAIRRSGEGLVCRWQASIHCAGCSPTSERCQSSSTTSITLIGAGGGAPCGSPCCPDARTCCGCASEAGETTLRVCERTTRGRRPGEKMFVSRCHPKKAPHPQKYEPLTMTKKASRSGRLSIQMRFGKSSKSTRMFKTGRKTVLSVGNESMCISRPLFRQY